MTWTFLDLVAPVSCLVCDSRGCWLCATCTDRLAVQRRITATGLPVFAAAGRQFLPAITRWKDGGIRAATPALARLLADACWRLQAVPTAVVPVPARAAARTRRGWQPVAELAAAVAQHLQVEVVPLLEFGRQPVDQRGLTDVERRANLVGSLRARPCQGEVVLLDDVMTGGATLSAAHRALAAVGVDPLGAVVLASSRNRTPGRFSD